MNKVSLSIHVTSQTQPGRILTALCPVFAFCFFACPSAFFLSISACFCSSSAGLELWWLLLDRSGSIVFQCSLSWDSDSLWIAARICFHEFCSAFILMMVASSSLLNISVSWVEWVGLVACSLVFVPSLACAVVVSCVLAILVFNIGGRQ